MSSQVTIKNDLEVHLSPTSTQLLGQIYQGWFPIMTLFGLSIPFLLQSPTLLSTTDLHLLSDIL